MKDISTSTADNDEEEQESFVSHETGPEIMADLLLLRGRRSYYTRSTMSRSTNLTIKEKNTDRRHHPTIALRCIEGDGLKLAFRMVFQSRSGSSQKVFLPTTGSRSFLLIPTAVAVRAQIRRSADGSLHHHGKQQQPVHCMEEHCSG